MLEIECSREKVFVSWSGETVRQTSDTDGVLQINGLFGEKLGMKHDEQVTQDVIYICT